MNDNKKRTLFLTTLVCLIPVLTGVILYPKLPDTIATHWDIHGVPNGWSSKLVGAIGFPMLLVVINLIYVLCISKDPKYAALGPGMKKLVDWIIPIVAIICSAVTLYAALV